MLECSEFVNSDEFAKGLSPFQPEKASIQAGRYMIAKIRYLLKKQLDFGIHRGVQFEGIKLPTLKQFYEMMLDYLRAAELPFAVVATKTDKLNATERKKNLAAIEAHPLISGAPVIPFSAHKGEGKDELWKVIFKYTGL